MDLNTKPCRERTPEGYPPFYPAGRQSRIPGSIAAGRLGCGQTETPPARAFTEIYSNSLGRAYRVRFNFCREPQIGGFPAADQGYRNISEPVHRGRETWRKPLLINSRKSSQRPASSGSTALSATVSTG